jgi:hypothetical protein
MDGIAVYQALASSKGDLVAAIGYQQAYFLRRDVYSNPV